MPRWFSVIALAAVLVIVLHTLISVYQPTLAPWGRPPADIIKSPGNPIDEGRHLNVPESHEHQPQVEENTHTPETTHTEHVVEEGLGPKGHEILLIVGSNGKSRSNIEGMEDMVRENRLQYVELHGNSPIPLLSTLRTRVIVGYDFAWANFSEHRVGNAHPVWSKVPAVKDAFEKHPQAKWIWWLDLDAIIMTPEIDLAAHLLDPKVLYSTLSKAEAYHLRGTHRPGIYHTSETPDPNQINMIISGDHNGINAGSFFLRRSTWTEMFLDLWLDPFYVENVWPVQEQDAIIHMIQHHAFVREHVGI